MDLKADDRAIDKLTPSAEDVEKLLQENNISITSPTNQSELSMEGNSTQTIQLSRYLYNISVLLLDFEDVTETTRTNNLADNYQLLIVVSHAIVPFLLRLYINQEEDTVSNDKNWKSGGLSRIVTQFSLSLLSEMNSNNNINGSSTDNTLKQWKKTLSLLRGITVERKSSNPNNNNPNTSEIEPRVALLLNELFSIIR